MCAPISKYHAFRYPFVREKIDDETNDCTFPGSTISCEGAERCGVTTATTGTAKLSVSLVSVADARNRSMMPRARIAPNTTTRTISPSESSQLRRGCRALLTSGAVEECREPTD